MQEKTAKEDRWLPFAEARALVRLLGLKSRTAFDAWWSNNKPQDIPSHPDRVYSGKGWTGWGDWTGTGNRRDIEWLSFAEARAFVRSLGLTSRDEWLRYWSEKRPAKIPSHPDRAYAGVGWAGWGDWTGTGNRRDIKWLPFVNARAHVRARRFNSMKEYEAWKGRPNNIPFHPDRTYADKGWVSAYDWLGKQPPKTRERA